MSLIKNDKAEFRKTAINLSLISLFIVVLTLFCKATGYPLIIPLLIFFLGCHLIISEHGHPKLFVQLGLLLALILFFGHIIVNAWGYSKFFIPVAWISMLTMLLFNSRNIVFIMTFASSLIVSLAFGGDFFMMVTFLLGGLAGAYTVRGARTRATLMLGGIFVSVIHFVCVVLFQQVTYPMLTQIFTDEHVVALLFNGIVCSFLVAATLKVFEMLFGVVTNFSLSELSDFNQPLLKRMILEAPGTYHHSLVVSNLAEAAADSIGANSLLTRVGAYYHDIGKMVKPEYFTENQITTGNKHDQIEPSMSCLVIRNHVKEGIDLAKKYRLNPSIIDFIPQHHGTGLMYYFYQKALEEAEESVVVNENDFRYPGPKPQMRETAILLLADSVEGATRALEDPNPANIEETVKKIVNNKFIDGQLDECNLTLKDIEKLSSTFIRILSAMYHSRIKYPERKSGSSLKQKNGKKNGNSDQKQPEENSAQSSPDQENHRENPSS